MNPATLPSRLLLRPSLLVAVFLLVSALGRSAAPERINVLFIVADDLNTALGAYGDPLARTPNIDRLAARGVTFDRAHAQYPLCNPSRVSFLTGRRPEATGVYVLNQSARAAVPDAVQLPQHFRQQGYFTAGAGKVAHSVRMNDADSWDHYQDPPSTNAQEIAAHQARYAGGDGRPGWTMLDTDGTGTRDNVTALAVRQWIAGQKSSGKPFFLAAGFHKPHLPWTAPKRFFDLYSEKDFAELKEPALRDVPPIALQTELSGFAQPEFPARARLAYYACVSFMDEQVGLLLDELDRQDLWNRTLVVFTSDHGFHLGDHGGLWAKLSAFGQATRVPLILAGAGLPAGRRVAEPVELLDLYPTIAAITGSAPQTKLDGRSLVETWQREPRAEAAAFSMVYHYDVASQRDVLGRTVITRDWRYTEWDGGRAGTELYVHAHDAGEYRNLAHTASARPMVTAAAERLRAAPAPIPGPANRPRALLPAEKK